MKESVSARCVFYHRNKRGTVRYLVGRRSMTNTNNQGRLQFLGGKVKAGETLEEAFHREGSEEAGDAFVRLYDGAHLPLGVVSYLHEDGHTRFFHHGFLQPVREPAQPEPKPRRDGKPPEHDAFFWLTFRQAVRRGMKFTGGQLELIERAENALATRLPR